MPSCVPIVLVMLSVLCTASADEQARDGSDLGWFVWSGGLRSVGGLLHPTIALGVERRYDGVNAVLVGSGTASSVMAGLGYTKGVAVERDAYFQPHTHYEVHNTCWALERVSGPDPIAEDRRHLVGARQFSYFYEDDRTGAGVTIFILDGGVLCTHQEFQGRASCPVEGDFGATDPEKRANRPITAHGTMVAGAAASLDLGVASGATIVSLQFINRDTGSYLVSSAIAGIEYARSLVRKAANAPAVINISGGADLELRLLDAAVTAAINDNIPVVVSVGNSPVNRCGFSPLRVPGVIVVGATTIDDRFNQEYSFGPCVTVLAPGVELTLPIWDDEDPDATDVTQNASGTSFSAGYVSGAVAIFRGMRRTGPWRADRLGIWLQTQSEPGLIEDVPKGTPNLLLQTTFAWKDRH
ncbi:serine protease [Savitreella phatthalungensis]